ncbi:MAG TPA: ribonuclease P protein component [Actinomycetota bacterium]|nr:ribonuclease P protein component [Actinomycetota bacterium]
MPRALRLTSSKDFALILASGSRGSSDLLTCAALAARDAGPARVGFSVSTRVGNAVKRNRARRLLREAVRATCVRSGYDVVLVGKPALAGRSLDEVRAALDLALERAGASC